MRVKMPPDYPGVEFDAHWRGLVSPADYVNPQPQEKYNLVVIGAGPAGLITAIGAAGLGAKVALVERHAMGGDCLNVGCVPSKAILSAAKRFQGQTDAFARSMAWLREVL
jgi:choline dehydrogenase-like flavoprotein